MGVKACCVQGLRMNFRIGMHSVKTKPERVQMLSKGRSVRNLSPGGCDP